MAPTVVDINHSPRYNEPLYQRGATSPSPTHTSHAYAHTPSKGLRQQLMPVITLLLAAAALSFSAYNFFCPSPYVTGRLSVEAPTAVVDDLSGVAPSIALPPARLSKQLPQLSSNSKATTCQYPLVVLMDVNLCEHVYNLYHTIQMQQLDTCLTLLHIDTSVNATADPLPESLLHNGNKTAPYDRPHCNAMMHHAQLTGYDIQWVTVHQVQFPDFAETPAWTGGRWVKAANKLHAFGLTQFEGQQVMVIDADALLVRELDSIFASVPFNMEIALSIESFRGCHARHTGNTGLFVYKPSRYLYNTMLQVFPDKSASPSGIWDLSEQELVNAVCGYWPSVSPRRDITCQLLHNTDCIIPNTWNADCSDNVSLDKIRAVHYAAGLKPWATPQDPIWPVWVDYWQCVHKAVHPLAETVAQFDKQNLAVARCRDTIVVD